MLSAYADCLRRNTAPLHRDVRGNSWALRRSPIADATEALRLNPALLKVQMPPDTPAPKRLRKAGTGLDAVPAAKQEKGPEVEADDIPF